MMGYISFVSTMIILNLFWYSNDNILGQVASEVMACLTVKMMQIAEIYPYFPHATWWKKQCIHYYSVN